MWSRKRTAVQIIETTAKAGTHFLRKKIPRNTAIHKTNIENITPAGYLFGIPLVVTSGCEQVKCSMTARLGVAGRQGSSVGLVGFVPVRESEARA